MKQFDSDKRWLTLAKKAENLRVIALTQGKYQSARNLADHAACCREMAATGQPETLIVEQR